MARPSSAREILKDEPDDAEPVTEPAPPGSVPTTVLLDARREGLDPRGLRALARATSARQASAYTSRSYSYPFALVAWHTGPVGVDIERIQPLDARFRASICTPREMLAQHGAPEPDALITSLWSSKEALAKALGNAVDYDPRRLESPLAWPDGKSGRWHCMTAPVPAGHVGWLCWAAASSHDAPRTDLRLRPPTGGRPR